MKLTLTVALVCFCLGAAASPIYNQVGPTGILPATAQTVYGENPLNTITGTLDTAQSIDLFRITITNPVSFSAQTIVGDLFFAPVATPILYLFSNTGNPIYADSDSGGSRQGYLGAGLPISPTTPGLYLLGITWFGNTPRDSAGRSLFQSTETSYRGGFFTSYAPAVGVGALANWNFGATLTEDGPQFQINLTSAAGTPEPASLLLTATGIGLLLWRRARR